MKISYNWINNYLNLSLPTDEIADLLTDIGLEVEGVEIVEAIKGGLKGVVIGEVLTKIQHPNADRLSLTTVNIGEDKSLQIVCGAPNVAVGQKVPVATVGTWLYDEDNKFKIKKGKIRGEESVGMICGEDELGLGEDTDGIMVLDTKAKAGMLASEYFKLESDIVFEILYSKFAVLLSVCYLIQSKMLVKVLNQKLLDKLFLLLLVLQHF